MEPARNLARRLELCEPALHRSVTLYRSRGFHPAALLARRKEASVRLTLAIGVLVGLGCVASANAQAPVASFPQVTAAPVPLHSVSGRFSSLNPRGQGSCPERKVSGRVVSPRLILVKEMNCGRPGHDNVLVNIRFANPADAAQMVTGRQVTITGKFTSAVEDRDPLFFAEFLIAEQAALAASDSRDSAAPPAPPFTSYMLCQPPELDALARKLGKELCAQNTLLPNLAALNPALEAAAR